MRITENAGSDSEQPSQNYDAVEARSVLVHAPTDSGQDGPASQKGGQAIAHYSMHMSKASYTSTLQPDNTRLHSETHSLAMAGQPDAHSSSTGPEIATVEGL